jgi:hypothetical protein
MPERGYRLILVPSHVEPVFELDDVPRRLARWLLRLSPLQEAASLLPAAIILGTQSGFVTIGLDGIFADAAIRVWVTLYVIDPTAIYTPTGLFTAAMRYLEDLQLEQRPETHRQLRMF